MAKKIQRKLTDKLKEKIKKHYADLKESDYGDDALRYLKQVKGGAKGRATQRAKVAKIDQLTIPKNSEIYKIIQRAAKIKGMTVAKFVKKYRSDIENLMQGGDIVNMRETNYLISDIKHMDKGTTVFVNDGNGLTRTPKKTDIMNISLFTAHVMQNSDIFMISYRVNYKLNGDLSHYLPSAEEYEELEDDETITEMLDSYYPNITYLKSRKVIEKKKDKRIDKRGGKRDTVRKGKTKKQSNNGRKR